MTTKWQELWDSTTKGRWTHKFFPDVRTRLLKPMAFGHYTAQMVSGHGDFNKKLHDLGLVEDPTCRCGHDVETAEHVLLRCARSHGEIGVDEKINL